jgi:hypothetical protein
MAAVPSVPHREYKAIVKRNSDRAAGDDQARGGRGKGNPGKAPPAGPHQQASATGERGTARKGDRPRAPTRSCGGRIRGAPPQARPSNGPHPSAPTQFVNQAHWAPHLDGELLVYFILCGFFFYLALRFLKCGWVPFSSAFLICSAVLSWQMC